MNKYLLAAGLLLASGAFAQKTVTEVAKPTTPEDDSKPNNDKVPEVYSMSGQLKRVVVLRFKYQADLLAGMEKVVKGAKDPQCGLSLRGRLAEELPHSFGQQPDVPVEERIHEGSDGARRHREHQRLRDRWPDSRAHDADE